MQLQTWFIKSFGMLIVIGNSKQLPIPVYNQTANKIYDKVDKFISF